MVCLFICRRDQAASRPKLEFVPKTLNDLHPVDIISDDINGKYLFDIIIAPQLNDTEITIIFISIFRYCSIIK